MRFIIASDSSSFADRDRDTVTALLEGKGWSVWHWFPDLWLIDGAPDNLSMPDLRDEIVRILPSSPKFMIMSTEGRKDHSGYVQTSAIPWIKEHWNRR